MDKQEIFWATFLAGGMFSIVVNEFLQHVYRTVKQIKERQHIRNSQS